MISNNPFAELAAIIPESAMQIYVVVMFLLVVGGTILDMMHKKSAQYFFENAKKAEKSAKRSVSGGEKMSIAVSTLTNEVLTSSEFQNPRRRVSHLFTMYGFIVFVVSTVWLIFGYATPEAAAPTRLRPHCPDAVPDQCGIHDECFRFLSVGRRFATLPLPKGQRCSSPGALQM